MKTKIMKNFAPLYSLNSNGSIQQWSISVEDNRIIKEYGQIGGKMQTVYDTIKDGKNIGRVNQTSPSEQAELEAKAQWEKKLKSGYSKTQADAKAGKVDTQYVVGGIDPMLAHKFRDHESKIEYPCHSQPKLDGIRCIAMVVEGKATLWSRTRKPITGVPHIIKAIESQFKGKTITLDGELYNHSYKNKFEEIVSFVKQETPKAGHEIVEYHIYDLVTKGTFENRTRAIETFHIQSPLVRVPTMYVESADDLMDHFAKDRGAGYEGTMVRNSQSLYECKRSYGLQKIKEMDDAEFKITGVKPGRGRMAECAIFSCTTKNGELFDCKMQGSLDGLKEILKDATGVIGKMLTVRYQGFTNGGVPRFPIGVVVRDYE